LRKQTQFDCPILSQKTLGFAARLPLPLSRASGIVQASQQYLAQMKLAEGDPVAAQSLLDQVPLEYSPGVWIWNTRFKAAVYLRDYDAADRMVAATPAKWADFAFDGPLGWAEGQIARARSDKQKAVAAFAAARKKVEAAWREKPKDASYFADVARLDAAIGQKEEAIRERRRAVELQPITAQAGSRIWRSFTRGPASESGHFEQLEIVATIPGYSMTLPSYGDLRFNPCWDSLRGDPRFDKIVAAAKATIRYSGSFSRFPALSKPDPRLCKATIASGFDPEQ
jgi:tetratricopeptide (TPR) repeat protein